MRSKQALKYVLLLMSGLVFSNPVIARDDCPDYDRALGAMLANTCAGCHGTNGVSAGHAIPNIAGLSADTINDSMLQYQSGDRPSTIMGRIARGYSEEEIRAMAGFFCEQNYAPAKQAFDAKKAELGMALHEDKCEKCHEDGGKLDEDGASILAGQWRTYLEYEFADFLSGHRDMPRKMKTAMDAVLKRDTDARVEQLIEFYISQQ